MLTLFPYSLPLKTPWRCAAEVIHVRRGVLIAINNGSITGWGDAAPLPSLGMETFEQCLNWLQQVKQQGIKSDINQALKELPPAYEVPPAARCGLESALLDVAAQHAGKSLARYLAPEAANEIMVNAMVGTLDVAPTELDAVLNAGFRYLKFKVGVAEIHKELAQLRALASVLPAGIRLRLDANCAWTFPQAQTFLTGIIDLPIEWVEEPLKHPTPAQVTQLRHEIPVPIALDESLPIDDPEPWLTAVDGVVLKPMRLGGLIPALNMARQAQSAGLRVAITSSLESAIGRYGAAHLAAVCDTLGMPTAHGLAIDLWLAHDTAPPLPIHHGYLSLPVAPGLGCQPNVNPDTELK